MPRSAPGQFPGEEYDPGDQDLSSTARLSAWLRNLSVLAPTSCSRHGRLHPASSSAGSWPGRPSNGSRRRCAYPYSRQARPHSPLLEVGIEIQNLPQPLTLRTEDFRDETQARIFTLLRDTRAETSMPCFQTKGPGR